MTRLEHKNPEKPVRKSDLDEDTSEAMDDIEGPLEDDHDEFAFEEDRDDDFDEANEPSGDPSKNVPSA